MSRLIDTDDAYKTLTEFYHHTSEVQHKALREALDRVPSKEIICCEDCKFSDDDPISDGRYWCPIIGAFMYYCSDAEKKC